MRYSIESFIATCVPEPFELGRFDECDQWLFNMTLRSQSQKARISLDKILSAQNVQTLE
jgi:hypothetical protein